MALQYSVAVRNAKLDQVEVIIGASAILKIRTGAPPATCATADSGTVLATLNLPSDWMSAAAAGAKAKLGTWEDLSADAAGTAGHFRLYATDGTTCGAQGTVTVVVPLTTNALTAANGNVLNFASTTGAVVGMNISGTGVPADTQVVAVTGTTVTMSRTSTAGVANGAAITFGGDMTLDNVVFALAQAFSVTSFTLTAPNA